MERSVIIARVFAVSLIATSSAAAQLAPPPIVDPASYRSRSGEYALDVDPSHIHSAGPATYRLSRNGRTVWSAERPFTLLRAGVADDGTAAGYACSTGLGFGDPGTLRLVILDPAGTVRLDDATPCRESRVVDGGRLAVAASSSAFTRERLASFPRRQGRELWMFDRAEKTMHRYEMP